MTVLYAALALIIIFALAAAVIGREARRLDAVAPNATFDLDEAVDWIAEQLPFEVSAVLSHDDVRRIVDWSLEFIRLKGVSGNGHGETPQVPIVVGEAETVDYVLTRALAQGEPYTSEQVHAVLGAQLRYFEAIGAVGPEVDEP